MAIVKVIEVIAQSEKGWEDATREAIREARKTVHGIQTIYIQDFQAILDDSQEIALYRINAKISFVVDEM